MANRVIRDWTTSESMDKLSMGAEVFFTRLIMKADDYGSFHSNPKLLKAALFPLKEYSTPEIEKWVDECIDAELIFIYTVDQREYIRINDFGQRLRNMRNLFPQPADNSLTTRGKSRPETKRNEVETNQEDETNDQFPFDDFWNKYGKKVDRVKCEKKWKSLSQEVKEKIMKHLDGYIPSTPEVKFRKDPSTYLNNNSWENDIIPKGSTPKIKTGVRGFETNNQSVLDKLPYPVGE